MAINMATIPKNAYSAVSGGKNYGRAVYNNRGQKQAAGDHPLRGNGAGCEADQAWKACSCIITLPIILR